MRSHDLAKLLLELPNLPVSTHADGHTAPDASTVTFGDSLKVALMERKVPNRSATHEIVIGNLIGYAFLEHGNNRLRKMYYGSITIDGVTMLPEKRK